MDDAMTKSGAKSGRPQKTGQPSITESTSYDTFGNVTTIGNGSVTYGYAYDLKNRPLSKTDSRGGRLVFTYDKAGNISSKTAMTAPSPTIG